MDFQVKILFEIFNKNNKDDNPNNTTMTAKICKQKFEILIKHNKVMEI